MEDLNTRRRFSFSFCELIDSPLEFNSLKKVEIRAMKFEAARIHFFGDVFAAVDVDVA